MPQHFDLFSTRHRIQRHYCSSQRGPSGTNDSVGKTGSREIIEIYVKRYVISIVKGYVESVCQAPNKVCMTGPPGQKGIRDSRGQRGPKGRNGVEGSQGIVGPPGAPVPRGLMGDIGVPGFKGEQGKQSLCISTFKTVIQLISQSISDSFD